MTQPLRQLLTPSQVLEFRDLRVPPLGLPVFVFVFLPTINLIHLGRGICDSGTLSWDRSLVGLVSCREVRTEPIMCDSDVLWGIRDQGKWCSQKEVSKQRHLILP